MTPTEEAELKQFLNLAASKGAAAATSVKHRETDGSDTVEVTDNKWRLVDNYFTGSDHRAFYGRQVIYRDDKPYWYLGYAGYINGDNDPAEVQAFLKSALLQPAEDMPIRGPEEFTTGDWQYAFIPGDGLEEFYAAEWIKHDGSNVYLAHLHGGLIA